MNIIVEALEILIAMETLIIIGITVDYYISPKPSNGLANHLHKILK
jgi:hypothetical protein